MIKAKNAEDKTQYLRMSYIACIIYKINLFKYFYFKPFN